MKLIKIYPLIFASTLIISCGHPGDECHDDISISSFSDSSFEKNQAVSVLTNGYFSSEDVLQTVEDFLGLNTVKRVGHVPISFDRYPEDGEAPTIYSGSDRIKRFYGLNHVVNYNGTKLFSTMEVNEKGDVKTFKMILYKQDRFAIDKDELYFMQVGDEITWLRSSYPLAKRGILGIIIDAGKYGDFESTQFPMYSK